MKVFNKPKLPFSTLGKKLESTFRKAIFDFQMLEENTIAIALSGGKDSLSLLYFFYAISGRGFANLEIHAIFIDGKYTCGASVIPSRLEKICQQLGVTFHSVWQEQSSCLSCYPCSRKRRSLLFEKAKSLGISTIAFGHHRDDNIETLLLNLLHKAEFSGLMPKIFMKKYQMTIIRPLIYMTEQDIIHFSKQQGFYRITCQCPFGQKSKRQEVKKILISLEKSFPNTKCNLAKSLLVYGSKKPLTP